MTAISTISRKYLPATSPNTTFDGLATSSNRNRSSGCFPFFPLFPFPFPPTATKNSFFLFFFLLFIGRNRPPPAPRFNLVPLGVVGACTHAMRPKKKTIRNDSASSVRNKNSRDNSRGNSRDKEERVKRIK